MKLQIFESAQGDCLLLEGKDKKLVLCDGGMRSSFKSHVRDELGKKCIPSDHAIPRCERLVHRLRSGRSHGARVRAYLDGEIEQSCDGSDRRHELADTSQVLNSHVRRLTLT